MYLWLHLTGVITRLLYYFIFWSAPADLPLTIFSFENEASICLIVGPQ